MMNAPLISVIIPVYNAARTLRECLKSIFASTYQHFEVLIVDDLSTDESIKIASEFPCRIISVMRKSGPAAARNLGAYNARGKILFFTDSDIIIKRDTIQKIIEAMEGKVAVTGMYSRKPYLKKFFSLYHNYYAHRSQKETSSYTFMFHTSCGAILKEVFERIGGFNENMKNPTVEDVEFGYRLMENGYRVYLDKTIQVTHFTNYTFSKLIKSYFYKSRDWAELLFSRTERLFKNEGWANFRNVFILLSALSIIPLIPLSFYNNLFLFFLISFGLFFIYQNTEFYKLILEENPILLIPGIIFNYFVNLVLFFGICAGLLTALKRRL
jgi:glycosyltransferase involved in cell wall biosynthesis